MADATDLQPLALRKSTKVERYAEVLAHVVHFGTERLEEVVQRFGFTVQAWRAVDAAWTDELAEGIRRNQQDLALRFSASFAKRRRHLAREQPSLEAAGEVPAKASAPGSHAPPQTPGVLLPSFMATPSKSMAPASPAADPMLPPPAPVASAAQPAEPSAQVTAAPVAAVPAQLDSAPAAKHMTQALPAVDLTADPLPFADGVAADVALRAALDHADNVQGPKPAKPPSLSTTVPTEGERLAAIARRILPFQPGAPAPDSDPGAAAPTEDAASLTLEQHASLHVELTLHPEQKSQTLRRYGLSIEQHARLDTVWQAKVAKDAALRASWEQACAQYRAWILRNKRRGG
jgi:hypothetical protein